jgi:hypothetical protein
MNSKRLPDFFIIGAQKSGTASLSALLSSRADVFMSSPREPMFFCRDDAVTHPHTLVSNRELWRAFDWQNDRARLLDEYAKLFGTATPDQKVGEGSATYLVSRCVPERIASVVPNARIIAMLRNPIDRAYSAYFHHLKNFRVVHRFEDQLKFEPWDLLETGNYRLHLERYLHSFPKEQLLVIAFEEFVRDTQRVFDRVCQFLRLPSSNVDAGAKHSNPALVPRFIKTQRLLNYGLRLTGSNLEAAPIRVYRGADTRPIALQLADKAIRALGKANRGRRKYPPIPAETRALLRDYYRRQNAGLSQLVGVDFARYWPDFSEL